MNPTIPHAGRVREVWRTMQANTQTFDDFLSLFEDFKKTHEVSPGLLEALDALIAEIKNEAVAHPYSQKGLLLDVSPCPFVEVANYLVSPITN